MNLKLKLLMGGVWDSVGDPAVRVETCERDVDFRVLDTVCCGEMVIETDTVWLGLGVGVEVTLMHTMPTTPESVAVCCH